MHRKENILLLVGGASAEREVSKRSSKAIYGALSELGYTISLLDPAYGKNQPIEVEGGEVIINKQASKENCEILSEINQSAGGGVALPCEDMGSAITDNLDLMECGGTCKGLKYKHGGKTCSCCGVFHNPLLKAIFGC